MKGCCRSVAVFFSIAVLLFSCFLLSAHAEAEPIPSTAEAKAVWFYHLESGREVLSQNADDVLPAGSTVKILSGLIACERLGGQLNETVTVTKGWSEAYGLFLKGESDLVLSYTTSPAYHILEEKKDNYAAANFSEGHYLQVEVAARTAASKQPELAQKFLQFMVSPAFQNAIPTGNWMYPVANVTLPAGFEQLTKPATTLEFTPAEVAAQRQAWISEWQRAVSR